MKIESIQSIITEKNIIILSPHYDDVLFMMGGYILEMEKEGHISDKKFDIKLLFSRSTYQARSGESNFDTSIERIKLATGNRLIEDQNCINELLGRFNYQYELIGEDECLARGKSLADSPMEFPHGTYKDFDREDDKIFDRMKERIRGYAMHSDTAIIFPLAIKEHIDHFIIREAGIVVAKELGDKMKASFYFIEDKPYGGLANQEELDRIENFIKENSLESRLFRYDPELMIELAFRHYISQVEEVYKEGVRSRANFWKDNMKVDHALDRICLLKP